MYNVVLLQDELSLAYFFHYYAINKVKKKVIWFIPYIFFQIEENMWYEENSNCE